MPLSRLPLALALVTLPLAIQSYLLGRLSLWPVSFVYWANSISGPSILFIGPTQPLLRQSHLLGRLNLWPVSFIYWAHSASGPSVLFIGQTQPLVRQSHLSVTFLELNPNDPKSSLAAIALPFVSVVF